MIAKSIDDAMQLSHSYGFQQRDFGHTVILFVLSIIRILTDCILEDWGTPSISNKEHDNICAIGVNTHRDLDGKGSPLDMRDKHREQLWRKNKLMTLEVVEQITANKNAQVFLRLVYLNTYAEVSYFLIFLFSCKFYRLEVCISPTAYSLRKNINFSDSSQYRYVLVGILELVT